MGKSTDARRNTVLNGETEGTPAEVTPPAKRKERKEEPKQWATYSGLPLKEVYGPGDLPEGRGQGDDRDPQRTLMPWSSMRSATRLPVLPLAAMTRIRGVSRCQPCQAV